MQARVMVTTVSANMGYTIDSRDMGQQSVGLIHPDCAAHIMMLTHTASCDINEDSKSKNNK